MRCVKIDKYSTISRLLLLLVFFVFSGLSAQAACTNAAFGRAERLIVNAFDSGMAAPTKGRAVPSVLVRHTWWDSLGASGQRGFLRAFTCAVAGPGNTLKWFRVRSMSNDEILYDSKKN